MAAKKAAIIFSCVLLLLGLIDFANRLTVDVALSALKTTSQAAGVSAQQDNPALLNRDTIAQLLSWADIKPKVAAVAEVKPTEVAPVVATPPPVVPKPPDIHKVVEAAIAGDVSKHLIGDELLSLKGLFYDGKEFAAVEIENIKTKAVRHETFAKGKAVADFQLAEIGKYHVVLKKQDQTIKLQLFERSR